MPWTAHSPHPANCAHCVADTPGADSCPAGWTGVDCGACASRDVCPDKTTPNGATVKAKGCTNACLVPTQEELTAPAPVPGWERGKAFSCRCGGDARTDPFCKYQPDTSFHFHITSEDTGDTYGHLPTRGHQSHKNLDASNADTAGTLRIRVKEYAGIPDMSGVDDPDWKYAYAFAPVWDANFTGCTWKVSTCLEPFPVTQDCVIYECPSGTVECPPGDLPECPGRNLMGCGSGPNSSSRYWQHPCNPLVTPQDRGITFWCGLNASTSGDRGRRDSSFEQALLGADPTAASSDDSSGYLCYWTQPGVIPSFAVTCNVGNCLYDDIEDDAAAMCPDASFTPPEFWTGDLVTKIAMFAIAVGLVALATAYVKIENKALYSLDPRDTDAFERVIAAASMTRPLNQPPPHHVRTVSMVVGRGGGGGVRNRAGHARDSTLESMPEEATEMPETDTTEATRATTISWESVHVYATMVTPSRPGGVTRRILRGVSGYAGPAPHRRASSGSAEDDRSNTSSSTSTSNDDGITAGLFAILGPSGAGKSTLLDFLAGRTPRGQVAHGAVRLDGVVASSREVRHASGYVQQTDVLPGTSTVWEHLMFNAMLRLPLDTTRDEMYRTVVGWMRELGLVKVATSLIGDEFTRGLSGGEKRRVSIATELLTSPGIMFLDEPTTGLDSTNAAKVVDILSGLGSIGVTVVLSIHQPRPDIFRLLDRVLVMSSVGGVIYSGPSAAAEAHFASMEYVPNKPEDVNAADFMLDTVLRASDADVARMIEDYLDSPAAHQTREAVEALAARERDEGRGARGERRRRRRGSNDMVGGASNDDGNDALLSRTERGEGNVAGGMPGSGRSSRSSSASSLARNSGDSDRMNVPAAGLRVKEKYRAGYWRQVAMLWRRMSRNVRRHPFLILLHFVATFMAAVSIGAVFFDAGRDTGGIQNRMGGLFFVLLYLSLMSLSSLPVWREDRLLFLRERASGAYGTDAYFTSMVCFDIFILRVLPPVFFTLITYPMVGLHAGDSHDPMATVWCLVWFTVVVVLTNVCASALCMAIGIVTPSNAVANVCGLLVLLVSVLSGGFLLNRQGDTATSTNPVVGWLTSLSFVNYAYEALLINEFLDAGTFHFTPKFYDSSGKSQGGVSVEVTGKEVLQFFSFGDTRETMVGDLSSLCLLAGTYLVLAYVLLKWSVRRSGVSD